MAPWRVGWTKNIILFPRLPKLSALIEVESAYNKVINEEVQMYCQKGPFLILDNIQQIQIRFQKFILPESDQN